MVHSFNPSTQEAEASLIYRVSSRTAKALHTHTHTHTHTQNPCLKKLNNNNNKVCKGLEMFFSW
jgi:hypothetical protein